MTACPAGKFNEGRGFNYTGTSMYFFSHPLRHPLRFKRLHKVLDFTMLLYFASEVGRLARSRRGYGGLAVNLRVNYVGKICKTQREIIANYTMLTFLERVLVRIGNYTTRKIPLETIIEGHKIVKTSQFGRI